MNEHLGPHNRIIQLQPWRNVLLALTEQGEVYELEVVDDRNIKYGVPRLTLLFPT